MNLNYSDTASDTITVTYPRSSEMTPEQTEAMRRWRQGQAYLAHERRCFIWGFIAGCFFVAIILLLTGCTSARVFNPSRAPATQPAGEMPEIQYIEIGFVGGKVERTEIRRDPWVGVRVSN